MLDTQGEERRARSPISLQIIPKDSKALQTAVWYQDNSLADVSTDRDVRVAAIEANGTVHALVFPCRRAAIRGSMLNRSVRSRSLQRIGGNGRESRLRGR